MRFARPIVGTNRKRAPMRLQHFLRDVLDLIVISVILVVPVVCVVCRTIIFIIEVVFIPEV